MGLREQTIQFITRRALLFFFKIYFLKIIFVDLGTRQGHLLWGPPTHRAACSVRLRPLDWLLPAFFSGFVLLLLLLFWVLFCFDPLAVGFISCVLYYIVKGILAET